MNTDMTKTNQDICCRLKKLSARLQEDTARLTELRNVVWLWAYNPTAFNAWYHSCYANRHTAADTHSSTATNMTTQRHDHSHGNTQ